MARPCDSSKAARWRAYLARWEASGESVRSFCARQGLSEQNFYRWRRVLAERSEAPEVGVGSAPRFVAVALEPGRRRSSCLEVFLPGGRRVSVEPGFDPETLAQVVAVLEGPPC